MRRFVGIALAVALLGTLLPSCVRREKKEEARRIISMEEAAEMQKKAVANAPPSGGPALNSSAPTTVGQDLNGKSVKLSDLLGKVVVLDFWATWCPPCRAMIPHATELVEKMEGKPFAFISVSADAKKETLTGFLQGTKMPWTHWWDGDNGPVARLWGIRAYPTVNVIDHKGILRHRFSGDAHELDNMVENLVKAAEDDKKAPSK